MLPAIVIIAFNRPQSLNRLLLAVSDGKYTEMGVTLIISIDYQASKEHEAVVKIANRFQWKFGRKVVLVREQNLGLKNHVLACGDLTDQYGAIIMLEDDIVVSPFFYVYAQAALTHYSTDNRIAGISLYNHKRNFCNQQPFELIAEYAADVYFLQIASSWGQAWTKKQWGDFRSWYNEGQSVVSEDPIPNAVVHWPESSWLKYFIKYLAYHQKYFVYPKLSFSTNFGDAGTHNLTNDTTYQVPICYASVTNGWRFIRIEESLNVYDAFYELLPAVIKKLNSTLVDFDFVVDIYGLKNLSSFSSGYALSNKPVKGEKKYAFGLNLKPPIANILANIDGSYFHLAKREQFDNEVKNTRVSDLEWTYFNGKTSIKVFANLLRNKVWDKLTEKMGKNKKY